jgi:hypothetical protein
MEIPFGVIESGSNVNELNPMIRGNSKRMSMLKPEIKHDDVPFGVTDRLSTVNDINPMRKTTHNFLPSHNVPKPYANDEIPFGIEESTGGGGLSQANPMRVKSNKTPVATPVKATAAGENVCTSKRFFWMASYGDENHILQLRAFALPYKADLIIRSSFAEPEPVAATATVRIKSEPSPLLTDLGAAVRAILLFIYILFEILYELGMDAIKPAAKR